MDMQDDDDIIPLLRNKEHRIIARICITLSINEMRKVWSTNICSHNT